MKKRSEAGRAETRVEGELLPDGKDETGGEGNPNPGLGSEPAGDRPPWGPRTFTVTWGEEKISPVQYNSLTVGPFSSTFFVPAGEDAGRYMDHANRELRAMAEVERERKVRSFLNKLHQSKRDA
jgi:hypothetical protein